MKPSALFSSFSFMRRLIIFSKSITYPLPLVIFMPPSAISPSEPSIPHHGQAEVLPSEHMMFPHSQTTTPSWFPQHGHVGRTILKSVLSGTETTPITKKESMSATDTLMQPPSLPYSHSDMVFLTRLSKPSPSLWL